VHCHKPNYTFDCSNILIYLHHAYFTCPHLSNPCTCNHHLETVCGYSLSCCLVYVYMHIEVKHQVNEQMKRKSAITARRNVRRNHKYK